MSYFTLTHLQRISTLSKVCLFSGSIVFLLLLISKDTITIVLGLIFSIFFIVSNAIAFFILFVQILCNTKKLQEHLTAMFLLFLNWPIGALYIYCL